MKIQRVLFLFCMICCLIGCDTSVVPKIHVFTWSNFIKPELIERFEKEYQCRVIIDTYDSNEAMYAKVKLGGAGYDILFPSNYIFDIMYRQGMLQAIEQTAVPNAKNMDPAYWNYIDSAASQYAIPYMITSTGIAYRNDKVNNFEPSWGMFGRTDLRGRMTMLNDIREAIGASLKYLGYSVNTTREAEVEKAADVLIQWKRNLAKFESEQYKNGIASAEYLVVQGYSGDILQVMRENPKVAFAYPKEGTLLSIDYIVIPAKAPNKRLAEAFINFLLDPKITAENIVYTNYLSPNLAAYEHLPPELRRDKTLFPSDEVKQQSEAIKNLGENISIYIRAWDRIKAAD